MHKKRTHYGTTSPSWHWCILHCQASIPSPKDKVNKKVANQSASQSISGLIVQSKAEKSIQPAVKSCVNFRHKDFGGQLIWALPRYVIVDIQGPEEAFFEEEPQQPTTRAAGNADSAVDPSGTAQDNAINKTTQQPQQQQQHQKISLW